MIVVLSRHEAERFTHPRPYVMISFHDEAMAPAILAIDPNRRRTLILAVDDEREMTERSFGRQYGEYVARILLESKAKGWDIVAHCNAGVSRSRGVGVAAALLFGDDPIPHFAGGNPSPLVAHHILAAARAIGAQHTVWPKMLRPVMVCERHPHDLLIPGRNSAGLIGTCPTCGKIRKVDNGDTLAVWNGSFVGLV
jgi:hypothetical protein